MRPARLGCVAAIVSAQLLVGCGGDSERAEKAPAERAPEHPVAARASVDFQEVAAEVGIEFTHNTGAFGRKWLPETMGSGCAWIDFDSDGDPDALLLSGKDFAGHPTGGRQTPALFRNDGGRFVDVTRECGLDLPTYAMGVTYGDYDADGDPDIYVTAVGPNRLFRNDGGRFREVASELGVADPGFGSSASWLDYDRDGDLDLFTLNYVTWSPEIDIHCSLDGVNKSYCTPEAYRGASSRLYRNDGARFTDVTEAAGMADSTAKALGVICLDFDGDGRDDIFVANDTQPNCLYRNLGDGTFAEQGMTAGVAFDESGRARGAMGVDAADYDGSGRPSLLVGNFSNEMIGLYHNEGRGFFIDVAPTTAVGRGSLLTLAFGAFFFDFDLDGQLDIFVANGHVESDVQKVQTKVSYEQPPHLFRNIGDGRFEDVAPLCAALHTPLVARGAAAGDYDGDGDLDLLINTSGGAARLYRNDSVAPGRSVRIVLAGGAGSNPDGYGARVELHVADLTRTAWARAAYSYASQSERAMTFGLGDRPRADTVVVAWPSGKRSVLEDVAAGRTVVIREEEAQLASEAVSD